MYHGKVLYCASATGLSLKECEIDLDHPHIRSMHLWSADNGLAVEFDIALESTEAYDLLQAAMDRYCDRVACKIAYDFAIPFPGFSYVGGGADCGENDVIVFPPEPGPEPDPQPPVCRDGDGPDFSAYLLAGDARTYQYHRLYRSALGTADPVSQLLFLYAILQSLAGEGTRQDVDAVILQVEPSVPRYGNGRGGEETLYTCLRNEITRPSQGVLAETTSAEIKRCLGAFRLVVQEAIARFG
ncbi:hypothetical protein DFW101_2296 [Solidesulfovibrio carbinoliphilus subsp. oakridgensis]|uniref:Uncharacterized protein n=1 Tax=Solidesulfovibrio carbinoliphilus subsp. oakridgensis TaxID=694327 RepID=G7QAW0_9BACT|nr:hypothetical protein [Solidesulfovibrio carbinoliphilus]EHJ48301.1 hypothetical protein DFW101_2296 [Solidesulfovibrio carbinoliphilus subsp. oakridgensis]